MATAEIVRDASTSSTAAVVALTAEALPGSTQQFARTESSSESPIAVFFAPVEGPGESNSFWSTLFRASIRAFYSYIQPHHGNVSSWDRVSLELMRAANLGSNWDGEGAEAISPRTIRTAGILLHLAGTIRCEPLLGSCPPMSLVPNVDGTVTFKWVSGDKELKCTVSDDTVEVVRWRSSDRYESDGLWELPVQQVSEHLNWLMK